MLKEAGVDVVILGHSERRLVFFESNEIINEKILLALKNDLQVIFCVGETLQEREANKLESVLSNQIKVGLKNVASLENITIAYEPVWAIGTGKTASPKEADLAHKFIRSQIEDLYSKEAADNLIVQYGGSVKPDNAALLMSMENIDGALVGGASLDVENFISVINY